jgi:hypothetical protein
MSARLAEIRPPVTACWATAIALRQFARIAISRGPPRGQRGYRLHRPLAPGPWFRSVDPDTFAELYMAQLAQLDARQVLRDLARLAGGKVPALLCFERPGRGWCHRGLVAAWLGDALGLRVCEYGHEADGWGWQHPMLPTGLRRSRPRRRARPPG